jgi:hypothetical protein
MRLGRSKPPDKPPFVLPTVSESVVLNVGGTGRIPARVLESAADSLLVAITVPTRALTAAQLGGMVLEYSSNRGRVRLGGNFSMAEPGDPDLVRIDSPRSVEVLQEREYVRIASTRPAVVYSARNQTPIQSYTVDVSGGGFLLAGPDSLKIGDEVTFQLTLTPGVLLIGGKGKIVRTDRQGHRAIVFDSISDLDRRRLVRFIFECQRAERRRGLNKEDHVG